MVLLHLLRHGQHNLGGGVLAGRMPGVGLTERGRAEIAAACERLAGEDIICAILQPAAAHPRERRDRFRTAGFADRVPRRPDGTRFRQVDGATFDAIRSDPRWRSWSQHRSLAKIPGGETMRAVQFRAVEAVLAIGERHRDGACVILSHGDVIRSALVFALGMPLDFYSRIEVAQGSLSTIRIDGRLIRVIFDQRAAVSSVANSA